MSDSGRSLAPSAGWFTTPDGVVDGVSFAVWAPNANGVSLIGEFNGWTGNDAPMRVLGSSGVWELFWPGFGHDGRCNLRVRPVFHYRPDRVVNHVRICFLAYWISARLAAQWRAKGERGEVTRILRQLQTIRLGQIHIAKASLPDIARFTQVPASLNALLQKLDLLHLFAAPPKWAQAQPA